MNERSTELAALLVDAQSRAMSPALADIRRELDAELSDGALVMQSLHQAAIERSENLKLISAVQTLFASKHTVRHYVRNQSDARLIQATSLWVPCGPERYELDCPYLPIGTRPVEDEPDKDEHLLLSGGPKIDILPLLRTAVTSRETTRALNDYSTRILTTPFSEKDVHSMYDARIDLITVEGSSPGSIRIPPAPNIKTRLKSWIIEGELPDAAKLTRDGTIRATYSKDGEFDDGLTNDEMKQFGVPERLGWLATMYGVESSFKAAIRNPSAFLKHQTD